MLVQHGHEAVFIRDYVPPGWPDPLVATVAQELDAVLVSFDGDFQLIAPRIPKGHRQRFQKLSRIWLRRSEPQAAKRLEVALSLVVSEYGLARPMRRCERGLRRVSSGRIVKLRHKYEAPANYDAPRSATHIPKTS